MTSKSNQEMKRSEPLTVPALLRQARSFEHGGSGTRNFPNQSILLPMHSFPPCTRSNLEVVDTSVILERVLNLSNQLEDVVSSSKKEGQ